MANNKRQGRNKLKCDRYKAQRRDEVNKARRAKARARRIGKRGAEMAHKRAAKAAESHKRRHLLQHGLPATESCPLCAQS